MARTERQRVDPKTAHVLRTGERRWPTRGRDGLRESSEVHFHNLQQSTRSRARPHQLLSRNTKARQIGGGQILSGTPGSNRRSSPYGAGPAGRLDGNNQEESAA